MRLPNTGTDATGTDGTGNGDTDRGSRNSGCPLVIDPAVRDLDGETRRLRELGGLARIDLLGVTAWSITDHSEARRLLTDARLVKDIDQWESWRTGEVTRDWPLIGMVDTGRSMFTVDGSDHRRLRMKTAQAITPRRLEKIRPIIERTTSELLDDLGALDVDGAVDLKPGFAQPLPMTVVGHLMGVDPSLHPRLHALYQSFFSLLTPQDERLAVIEELDRLFADMVAQRVREPADDLTSALILAEDGGEALTEDEVVGNLKAMIAAGHETTVSLILNAVRALLTHPDQLRTVLDGEVGWDAVVEETLRWDGPVTHLLMRFATDDIAVSDGLVRAGEAVVISYRAVGRDRREHGEDADAFDVRRGSASKNVSFGHGPHICPGAALARMEAGIALPALFERFPDLRPAVPVEEIRNRPVLTQNDLDAFPVHLHGR